ncbi:hypothetical protein [Deinococcus pimensis]|uniref:hypothetical protein n=1 Tax=Deinococcus pimensis TaxID=309888 RepID=UPI000486EBC0|nr:hypothetical protein [Deinococcus pimensis]
MTRIEHHHVIKQDLELRADALAVRQKGHREQGHEIARDAYQLYLDFTRERGRGFYSWYSVRTGRSTGTISRDVRIGAALTEGMAAETDEELHAAGQALIDQAVPVQQVRKEVTTGKVRAATKERAGKGLTEIRVPTGEADTLARAIETARHVSPTEALADPEATARLARGWLALPDSLRHAALAAETTGEDVMGALIKVIDEARDYRAWLATQPCAVCGLTGVQLHHLRLPDLPGTPGLRRFRDQSNDLLLPLCAAHHQDARDAAHRMSQDDWSASHFERADAAYVLGARYLTAFVVERDRPAQRALTTKGDAA